ncbi:MAG: glycerate kinase [Bacteroidota bacterium]
MKFVLAPDKYKGSLSGEAFCEAAAAGLKRVFPEAEILKKPLADGGDGTLAVMQHYLAAETINTTVRDPLFREINSGYLFSKEKGIAFIEMSEASGYKLLSESERNCMQTTTLGTGDFILDAVEQGATKIILGIGGSATNDAGIGMAHALGFRFLDETGEALSPIGENLSKIKTIDRKQAHPKLKELTVKVACDVKNPLYGEQGAAHIYGPQKGATPEEVLLLDKGLQHFARVVHEEFKLELQQIPGAGAAGGLGAGAIVFLNASLTSGIDLVMELADFDNALQDADWVITGEGQFDEQTLSGKTIAGVLKVAKERNIPVAALCGSVDINLDALEKTALDYVTAVLNTVGSLDKAKKDAFRNLELAAYNFAKLLKAKSI